jgi:hypothetical protein
MEVTPAVSGPPLDLAAKKTVWRYLFSGPRATREDRRLVAEVGFASKQDAIDAEAKRRIEELQKFEFGEGRRGYGCHGASDDARDAIPRVFSSTCGRETRSQNDRTLPGTGRLSRAQDAGHAFR